MAFELPPQDLFMEPRSRQILHFVLEQDQKFGFTFNSSAPVSVGILDALNWDNFRQNRAFSFRGPPPMQTSGKWSGTLQAGDYRLVAQNVSDMPVQVIVATIGEAEFIPANPRMMAGSS